MSSRYSARGYGRYDREDFYRGRYGSDPEYDYERGYAGRGRRDFSDRAGDEVRSWLGDDEAERRRRMDEGRGWREDEGRGRSEGYGSDYGRYGGEGYSARPYAGLSSERGVGDDSILVRLSDTDFDVSGDDDIRGRRVTDRNGNDIGSVDDLIVDPDRRRVRFLLVTSGGFLGMGGTTLLVPVEITDVARDMVTVSGRGGRWAAAARFSPTLLDRGEYGGRYGRSHDRSETWERSRGRGPRGYKRSDDRIREDVNDRLADDPVIDASDVEVMVSSGEVTLNGTVVRRADKRRAEDLAERVSGVTHVQNNLRVQREGLGSTTGGATATTAAGTPGTSASTAATGTSRGTAAGSTSG